MVQHTSKQRVGGGTFDLRVAAQQMVRQQVAPDQQPHSGLGDVVPHRRIQHYRGRAADGVPHSELRCDAFCKAQTAKRDSHLCKHALSTCHARGSAGKHDRPADVVLICTPSWR